MKEKKKISEKFKAPRINLFSWIKREVWSTERGQIRFSIIPIDLEHWHGRAENFTEKKAVLGPDDDDFYTYILEKNIDGYWIELSSDEYESPSYKAIKEKAEYELWEWKTMNPEVEHADFGKTLFGIGDEREARKNRIFERYTRLSQKLGADHPKLQPIREILKKIAELLPTSSIPLPEPKRVSPEIPEKTVETVTEDEPIILAPPAPPESKKDFEYYKSATEKYFIKEYAEELWKKYSSAVESLEHSLEEIKGLKNVKAQRETIEKKLSEKKAHVRSANSLLNKKLDEIQGADKSGILNKIELNFKSSGGILTDEQKKMRIAELEEIAKTKRIWEFYPTPRWIVEKMLAVADLKPKLDVLEPEAGSGNIAEVIRELYPKVNLEVIELHEILRDILFLKDFKIIADDFLAFKAYQFDRIVMNPPFTENADIKHINHAYSLLKPGGKLVSLLSQHALYFNDPYNIKFAQWVKNHGIIEDLKVGAFKTADRQADVDVSLIVVNKPIEKEETIKIKEIEHPEIGIYVRDKHFKENIYTITAVNPYILKPVSGYAIAERKYEQIPNNYEQVGKEELDDLQKSKSVVAKGRSAHGGGERVPRQSDCGKRSDSEPCEPEITEPIPIITARAEYTRKAKREQVSKSNYPILSKDQLEGVNLAIESLEGPTNAFLLADGTGAGKTMQELVTAKYFLEKYDKPVLIFTESRRIIEQSFMGDAQKLGFSNLIDFANRDYTLNHKKIYIGIYKHLHLWGQNNLARLKSEIIGKFTVTIGKLFHDAYKRANFDAETSYNVYPKLTAQELKNYVDKYLTASVAGKLTELKKNVANEREKAANRLNKILEDFYKYTIPIFELNKKKFNSKADKSAEAIEMRKQIDESRNSKWGELNNYFTNIPERAEQIILEDAWLEEERVMFEKIGEQTSCIIFDESHNLKNFLEEGSATFGYQARRAMRMANASQCVLFASATPLDKVDHIFYLNRIGHFENKGAYEMFLSDLGYQWVEPKFNENNQMIRRGRWKLDQEFPSELQMSAIDGLYITATEKGSMIKRELILKHMSVDVRVVDIPRHVEKELENIEEWYKSKDEMSSKGLISMQQSRALEPHKWEKTVELTEKAIANGESVVIFCGLVDEGEENQPWGGIKAGTVATLYEIFAQKYKDCGGKDFIGILAGLDELGSGSKKEEALMQNIDDFQHGKKRIMLATHSTGGAGISLDDTEYCEIYNELENKCARILPGGCTPRTIICMTAPMSANVNMQMLGRIYRKNTKSKSKAIYIFGRWDAKDIIPVEYWSYNIMKSKMFILSAVVSGEVKNMEWGELQQQKTIMKEQTKHTLWKKAVNTEINGEDYPRQRKIIIGKFNDFAHLTLPDGKTKDERGVYIRIRAKSSELFNKFISDYSTWIEEMKAKYPYETGSDKFKGKFIQFADNDEIWGYLLNYVKAEKAQFSLTADQVYQEGDRIRANEDITQADVIEDSPGKVIAVKKRVYYDPYAGSSETETDKNGNKPVTWIYKYDVKFDNGNKAQDLIAEQLKNYEESAENVKKYKDLDRILFDNIEELYNKLVKNEILDRAEVTVSKSMTASHLHFYSEKSHEHSIDLASGEESPDTIPSWAREGERERLLKEQAVEKVQIMKIAESFEKAHPWHENKYVAYAFGNFKELADELYNSEYQVIANFEAIADKDYQDRMDVNYKIRLFAPSKSSGDTDRIGSFNLESGYMNFENYRSKKRNEFVESVIKKDLIKNKLLDKK